MPKHRRVAAFSRKDRMITAHIHADLIAAFLGEDDPCYGACQCAACRASGPRLDSYNRTAYDRVRAMPEITKVNPASDAS
jgi:hypothetical protein